jgi:hypothetical protein
MDVIYKQGWHTGQVLVPLEHVKCSCKKLPIAAETAAKVTLGLTLSWHSALIGDANNYL